MEDPSGRPRAGEPVDAVRRHLRVGKADMRDFYAIVESYEGLTTLRTIEHERNIVQLDVAPGMEELFDGLLEALGREMDVAEVPGPGASDGSRNES